MVRRFISELALAPFLIMQTPRRSAELPPLLPRVAELPRAEMPTESAPVLSFGHVDHHCPTDPQMFESMVKNMARSCSNTLHCVYTDWRHEICKQYGMRMLIDLSHAPYDLKRACNCQGPWVDVVKEWGMEKAGHQRQRRDVQTRIRWRQVAAGGRVATGGSLRRYGDGTGACGTGRVVLPWLSLVRTP